MQIDTGICIGCGSCVPYCPASAIFLEDDWANIDGDLCFECGVCLRSEACPVEAIYEDEGVYQYPRSVRKFFSDPTAMHKLTKMRGRGTAEVKTNDVTNRYKSGRVGILLEVGRPTVGTRLREMEKLTMGLARAGFNKFEKNNPVTGLMLNQNTGKLKDEVLGERILSAILEIDVTLDKLKECLVVIDKLSNQIDTVFTMSLITRCESGMKIPFKDTIVGTDFFVRDHVKVNIGIGRCTN